MENLKGLDIQEISNEDLKKCEGGFLLTTAVVIGFGLLGVAAGYAICCAID